MNSDVDENTTEVKTIVIHLKELKMVSYWLSQIKMKAKPHSATVLMRRRRMLTSLNYLDCSSGHHDNTTS